VLSSRPAAEHPVSSMPPPQLSSNSETGLPGETRTLAASPNSLEVGVANGTHGWLRVRAELDQSGMVTAAVVASSATSAETLSRHLPEMSAYLAQESTRIGMLVVHASAPTGASSTTANSSTGFAAVGQFGGGQQGGKSAGEEARYLPTTAPRQRAPAESYDYPLGLELAPGVRSSIAGLSAWQGGIATHWVSVRV